LALIVEIPIIVALIRTGDQP